MKRLSFILLIAILTQSGCESSNSSNNEETSNSEKSDSTIALEPQPIVDSIDHKTTHDTTQIIQKAPEQKDTSVEKKKRNQDHKAINIEDALDVNKYKSVRDDPDYIGTPCEIVNGECIRHNHKDESQPDEEDL